jgi:hypothetical protein
VSHPVTSPQHDISSRLTDRERRLRLRETAFSAIVVLLRSRYSISGWVDVTVALVD